MTKRTARQGADDVEPAVPFIPCIGYSAGMNQNTAEHVPEISLTFLVGALLFGHIMASMALLVLPALAPVVAREYRIDAVLIGYFISLVGIGQLATLTWFGNLTHRYGGCRVNQMGHGTVALAWRSRCCQPRSIWRWARWWWDWVTV